MSILCLEIQALDLLLGESYMTSCGLSIVIMKDSSQQLLASRTLNSDSVGAGDGGTNTCARIALSAEQIPKFHKKGIASPSTVW